MKRKAEIRFQIIRDFWNDNWNDYCRDEYPVLFGTKEEAEARMVQLQGGSDPSWHDPSNGTLEVCMINI